MSFELETAWMPNADASTENGDQHAKIELARFTRRPKQVVMAPGVPNPEEWLMTAAQDRPRLEGLTPWFSGGTTPAHIGWYERHFNHTSQVLGCKSMNWWDGQQWRLGPHLGIHPRQVGSYPAWRGMMASA